MEDYWTSNWLITKTFKKGCTSDLVFLNEFGEIRHKYNNYRAIFTDGSKDQNKVGAACVSGQIQRQIRLPDVSSIYTAELTALKMALDLIEEINGRYFVIFTDSLSCLMALQNRNLKHPYIVQLLETLSKISSGKRVVFV